MTATKHRRPGFFAERINSHRALRPWSILGLVLVPLLVAGLLLGTTWGRDSRLHQIEAAVVNQDKAVTVNGQMVPMGRQLAAEITSNETPNVHWTLSDPSDAAEGLASGRYSAVVTIPENFSKAATSVSDADKAEQAVIQVTTSPASAVEDAQIARQVADLATQSTNRMLTGEYLKNIYVGFNTMGQQMVTMSDAATQLADGAQKLDDGTTKAASGMGQLGKGISTLDANSAQLNAGGTKLADGGSQLVSGASQLAGGIGAYTSGAGKVVDGIGQLDTGVQAYTSGAGKLVDGIGSFNSGVQDYTAGVGQYTAGVTKLNQGVQQLNDQVQQVPSITPAQIQQTQQATKQIQQYAEQLGSVQQQLAALPATAGRTVTQQCLTTAAAQLAAYQQAATSAGAPLSPEQSAAVKKTLEQTCSSTGQQAAASVAGALQEAGKNGITVDDKQLQGLVAQMGQLPALLDGINQLKAGVTQLADGSQQLADNGGKLTSGGSQLAKGAQQMASQSQQLKSGGAELAKGSAQLASQSQQLKTGGNQLATGASTLATGLGTYTSGVSSYVDGVQQYTAGVGKLNTGAQQLSGGMTQLASGSGQLADGTKKFADGLAAGKDKVPSYSQEQREKLSTVVSDPVTGGADGVSTPLKQTTTLLLVLGAWLGALATWLLMRPVASRTLTSSRPSWQLAAATMLPSAGIAVGQAIGLGVLGANVMDLGWGRGLGLVAFLSLASLAFMAINQALVAWLGGIGRTISVVLATVTAAVGLVSAVPGLFGTAHGLSPLAPALDGVRAIVARTTIGVGPIGILLALWLAAAVACLLAVVRRRQLSPAAYRRSRGGEALR
ncbi:YhgE/Pip domain-containing protein [Luteococcus peritonei]|uniref:YhgE/Pip domain-containing protein n=1 Tax=Luteococcus peritonei TaxID=88874 RepID=A0ABW4RZT8_9ACTN